MQKFLNLNKNIDFLEIYMENFSQIESAKNQIKDLLPDYFNIIDWRALNPSLFNALEVEKCDVFNSFINNYSCGI